MEKYNYPEIFVKGLHDGKYCIVQTNNEFYLIEKEKLGRDVDKNKIYTNIIYEEILNYVDLVEARIQIDTIVVPEFTLDKKELKGIFVKKDTPLCLIEVKGIQPYVFIKEGDNVDEKDKIAYTITGKGEVRVTKSPCKGIVLLVINLPWEQPEKYILAVVSKDDAREIIIRKS